MLHLLYNRGIVRRLGVSTSFAVVFAAALAAQAGVPPQARPVDQRAIDFGRQLAEDTKTDVGSLTSEALHAFAHWEIAARDWQKEKDSGAGPHLARGVLYDCLSRLKGVITPGIPGEDAPFLKDNFAQRPNRAADAFEKALAADPNLIEAQVRLARLRGLKSKTDAVQLEALATSNAAAPFPYLAAMFRAETFQGGRDVGHAAEWYRKAIRLNPQSAAAAIAMSILAPGETPVFAAGAEDPYYAYPCTILTRPVADALAAHVASLRMAK